MAAGERGEALHVLADDAGDARIERVARFASLEEHIGVLGGAAEGGVIGRERPGAEVADGLFAEHGPQDGIIDGIDLRRLHATCGSRRNNA